MTIELMLLFVLSFVAISGTLFILFRFGKLNTKKRDI